MGPYAVYTEITSTSTFCVCGGGDIPAPKKLKAPGKAVEIPGKHGKSRETRKKSREIPGHFSSTYIKERPKKSVFAKLLPQFWS